jgi:PhnB protein
VSADRRGPLEADDFRSQPEARSLGQRHGVGDVCGWLVAGLRLDPSGRTMTSSVRSLPESSVEERRVQLHTYLNYGGNCEEAFRYYEKHLGGKITMMMRHGEQPDAQNVQPGWEKAVLHARMDLGETELLGADIPPDRFQPIRSAYLSLTLGSDQEADRVFALLSDGGQIFMPMQETFFASRFAMLRDKFGTSWMLLHPRPQSA